jgi:hypothetical protein
VFELIHSSEVSDKQAALLVIGNSFSCSYPNRPTN